jgi:hypothetical protein
MVSIVKPSSSTLTLSDTVAPTAVLIVRFESPPARFLVAISSTAPLPKVVEVELANLKTEFVPAAVAFALICKVVPLAPTVSIECAGAVVPIPSLLLELFQ